MSERDATRRWDYAVMEPINLAEARKSIALFAARLEHVEQRLARLQAVVDEARKFYPAFASLAAALARLDGEATPRA